MKGLLNIIKKLRFKHISYKDKLMSALFCMTSCGFFKHNSDVFIITECNNYLTPFSHFFHVFSFRTFKTLCLAQVATISFSPKLNKDIYISVIIRIHIFVIIITKNFYSTISTKDQCTLQM